MTTTALSWWLSVATFHPFEARASVGASEVVTSGLVMDTKNGDDDGGDGG